MNTYLATEIAYKNGYKKALEDLEKLMEAEVDKESKYFRASVFEIIDNAIEELRKDNKNA